MSDIVTSQVFSDGEKGITATKMNNIIAGSVIQPAFYSAKPSTSTLDPTDVLLDLKGTGAYAQISGAQLINSVSASVTQNITPTIWSVRLRSFNAIGNPTFEVDQRTAGNGAPTLNTFAQDRWYYFKAGTLTASVVQTAASGTPPVVYVPGTNFAITSKFLRVTLGTVQATLGATDQLLVLQNIEGPRLRELIGDVHSQSILVRSSVNNLSFGLAIRDGNNTHSLVNLCTLGAANTWTLLPYPNLPVFTTAGSWSLSPGILGATLVVSLAGGSSTIAPANGTWQNGNFTGALGQMNFAAQVTGSTFDIAFIQHEPGNQCSTLIDCPFTQNYDDCLRYFTKTCPYGVAPLTVNAVGLLTWVSAAVATPNMAMPVFFKKPLAKVPTVVAYSSFSGTANTVRDTSASSDRVVNSYNYVGETGFGGFVLSTSAGANSLLVAHYTADTGW